MKRLFAVALLVLLVPIVGLAAPPPAQLSDLSNSQMLLSQSADQAGPAPGALGHKDQSAAINPMYYICTDIAVPGVPEVVYVICPISTSVNDLPTTDRYYGVNDVANHRKTARDAVIVSRRNPYFDFVYIC